MSVVLMTYCFAGFVFGVALIVATEMRSRGVSVWQMPPHYVMGLLLMVVLLIPVLLTLVAFGAVDIDDLSGSV